MTSTGSFFAGLRDATVGMLTAGINVDLLGHAGSGRTTLVASVTSALVELGWDVVPVRGVAALADRPLEALALADLVRRSTKRPESLVTSAVDRLRSAVADGRTVLSIDDADDLDVVSAGAIAAAHGQRPFPVLTTSRPRPSRREGPVSLRSSIRPGVVLDIPPLDFVGVLSLLADVLPGEIEPDTLARIDAVSGGLPNLIAAVATSARQTGRVRQVDGAWVAGSDLWTPGLARVVEPLVADLSESALEALQMLALAGAVTASVAAELVGWSALEEIDACGLLRFVPRGDDVVLGIAPPLVEERYRRMPLGARRLHFSARMAGLLDPSSAGDAPAATLLPRAVTAPWFWPGDAAPATAARPEPGRTAPGATDLADTVRARLMREDWHRRLLLRRREWEHDPSPATASPYLRALLVGDAGLEKMLAVIAQTPASTDQAQMVVFHRWHALVLAHVADDLVGARALLRRAAEEAGPRAALLHATEDYLTLILDRLPEPRAVPAQHTGASGVAAVVSAATHVMAGRVDEARTALAADDWSDPDTKLTRDVVQGMAHLVAGEIGEALTWSRRHLEQARDALDPEGVPGHAYVAVSALMLAGRMHEVRTTLGSVLSIGLTSSAQRHYTDSLLRLAAVLAARDSIGTPDASFYSQLRAAADSSTLPLPSWASPRSDLAVTDDDAEAADNLWEAVEGYLERGLVVSAVLLGGVALDLSTDARRVATLRAAVGPDPAGLLDATLQVAEAALDDPGRGVEVGDRLIDGGLVSLGVRATGHAIRRLRAAGAGREAGEVLDAMLRRLRDLGLDPDPLLGSLAPAQQLSPREQQVGSLVAQGMSNVEIARALGITPKTVENHLGHVLHKVGGSDRSDVVRVFRR